MSYKITKTSKEIIEALEGSGVQLKPQDKQIIIEKVYEAIVDASSRESNGCDCGQVSCQICGRTMKRVDYCYVCVNSEKK